MPQKKKKTKSSSKDFWEKWEYRTWLADSRLTDCKSWTRGVWVDWISHMMEADTYYVRGTLDDLATKGRTTREGAFLAVSDLFSTGAADVLIEDLGECNAPDENDSNAKVTVKVTVKVTHLSRDYNGKITVVNRKRARALKDKEDSRLRQERFRNKGKVTEMSREMLRPQSKSKSNITKVIFKSPIGDLPQNDENPSPVTHPISESFPQAEITPKSEPKEKPKPKTKPEPDPKPEPRLYYKRGLLKLDDAIADELAATYPLVPVRTAFAEFEDYWAELAERITKNRRTENGWNLTWKKRLNHLQQMSEEKQQREQRERFDERRNSKPTAAEIIAERDYYRDDFQA